MQAYYFVSKIEKEDIRKNMIYLFGGGKLVDAFLKADVVDEFIIGIIPIILGEGIPLFHGNGQEISLKLVDTILESGIVILKYTKR